MKKPKGTFRVKQEITAVDALIVCREVIEQEAERIVKAIASGPNPDADEQELVEQDRDNLLAMYETLRRFVEKLPNTSTRTRT